jgi:hypothetical protein
VAAHELVRDPPQLPAHLPGLSPLALQVLHVRHGQWPLPLARGDGHQVRQRPRPAQQRRHAHRLLPLRVAAEAADHATCQQRKDRNPLIIKD